MLAQPMLTAFVLLIQAAFSAPIGTGRGDALDNQVLEIFRKRCVVCHDSHRIDPAGDLGDLLDLAAISRPDRGFIHPETSSESHLRRIITDGSMPRRSWKPGVEWGGPLEDSEKTTLLQWIDRGGVSADWQKEAAIAERTAPRPDVAEVEMLRLISSDLQNLRGKRLLNARYLTLTNLHNMDSITDDQLQLFREGLAKTLNSLSRSSDVVGLDESEAVFKLTAVDPGRTILRFDLEDIGWTATDWDNVLQYYPYAMLHANGAGQTVSNLTSSRFPYVRGDWFCFAVLQPPLYHELLGIPGHLSQLEERLGVSRRQNILDRSVHRAGLQNSGVSRNNRLLERHTFRGGYYHISYDFSRNDGKANFFNNPFGPAGTFEKDQEFHHDGGEIIFRMPNGFQAYALVDSDGKRLSIAPPIVFDESMRDARIINGVSCISCHFDGMKPENPVIVNTLDQFRVRLSLDPARFSNEDLVLLEELFPEADLFGRLLEQDRKSFRFALQTAGIRHTADEPCRALFDQFARNLTIEAVAADFGVRPESLLEQMNRSDEMRLLVGRLQNGGVQRQLYVTEFRRLAERIQGLAVRDFADLPLPYFGVDPESSANPARSPATAPIEEPSPDNLIPGLQRRSLTGRFNANFREQLVQLLQTGDAESSDYVEVLRQTQRFLDGDVPENVFVLYVNGVLEIQRTAAAPVAMPAASDLSPAGASAQVAPKSTADSSRNYSDLGIGIKLVELPIAETDAVSIAATEVTQSQWAAVMKTEPWRGTLNAATGDTLPAVGVSWIDAVSFCEQLSKQTGRTVRLPTEYEWQAAADNAGNGSFIQIPPSANLGTTTATEAGRSTPNSRGIFDLYGNVWEWTLDVWEPDSDRQRGSAGVHQTVTDESSVLRVLRGGSFLNAPEAVMASDRTAADPNTSDISVGFRVVVED